jgi:hypothetical protein
MKLYRHIYYIVKFLKVYTKIELKVWHQQLQNFN